MLNSGFNQDEARKVLVSGVTKYIFLLECSEKPDSDANYKPLYISKEYNESARQISKYLAKMGWYKSKNAGKEKNENESGIRSSVETWKERLQGGWRDKEGSQESVEGREFSSLVQVPSTKDAKLLKALIKLETKQAGITGYNVKITEKPGIPLARLFQRTYSPTLA